MHLWRLAEEGGKTVATHVGTLRSSARVAAAGFSSDGRFIITASRSLRVFKSADANAAAVLRIENGDDGDSKRLHGGVFTWAEFTPKPGLHNFATSGLDGTARIWDWDPDGTEAPSSQVLKHSAAVRQVRFSPTGDQVLTVGDAGIAKLWDLTADATTASSLSLPEDSKTMAFACGAYSQHGDTQWIAAGGYSAEQQASLAFVWATSSKQRSRATQRC